VGLMLLAGVGLSVLPFSVAGLLLIVFGFALFGAEVWVTSYGALTLGGAVCVALGGILLFDDPSFDLRVDTGFLIAVPGTLAAITGAVVFLIVKAAVDRPAFGDAAIAGARAVVIVGGEGGGRVRFQGEDWAARWGGTLALGAPARVLSREGLTLTVEAIPEP